MIENFRLRVFRAVARHLNFRVAAEELLLTQPAVTQQIKALESELGVTLFRRAAGKVSLTEAGEVLLPYSEQISVLSEQAIGAVTSINGGSAGRLMLSASQTIGQYLLPRLIAEFLRVHPRVEISVMSGNTQTVLESVVDHRSQLGFIEGPAMRRDVQIDSFLHDEMVCVVPSAHEWADEEVELDAFRNAVLLTREQGSGSRRIVEQAFEKANFKLRDLKIGMAFDSTEGLLCAVEAGLGVAFVSRWAVRHQLALGTLKVARIKRLSLTREFSIVIPAGPEPSGVAGLFRRYCLSDRLTSTKLK